MASILSHENNQVYMEELDVGDIVTTMPQTISSSDVEQFILLTGDSLPQFLSSESAYEIGFKGRLVPGYLTLSLAAGLRHRAGLTSHVIAFMGMDKMRLVAPVYVGDSIKVKIKLLSKKETKTHGRVICTYKWQIINQDGNKVAEGQNT